MYVKKIRINNIRAISEFEMDFDDPAGWHVLIGDNGAGKSTIIRSIALALIGELQAQGLTPNWNDWLNKGAEKGKVRLDLIMDSRLDGFWKDENPVKFEQQEPLSLETNFQRRRRSEIILVNDWLQMRKRKSKFKTSSTEDWKGSFSVAYGPYRRFEGSNTDLERLFNHPFYSELAAHLSAFSESVALTEIVKWLKELHHKSLENDKDSQQTIEGLRQLINSDDFLPHRAQLAKISSEGLFFKDGNDFTIAVNQMSDGYRSILSLTFELIRQLVRVYGTALVFRNVKKGKMSIDLPGVVLVDEIDAHLHPTWQTRIGGWFTKYFPKLQFIVTTHSPLVCRAAENGSIWRLAAPKSEIQAGEVTGIDKGRLIFGNVLDAYGTEVFGQNITISSKSTEKRNKLAELNVKSIMGKISEKEEGELSELKAVFPTEKLSLETLK